MEFGEPPRGIQVTYDRAHSCTTQLSVNEVNWNLLLDTRLLHLTGITPPLSASCREIIIEAVRRAYFIAQGMLAISKARHVVVTFAEQGALLWNGTEWQYEKARSTQIIDRLGAGDALAAGIVHGWMKIYRPGCGMGSCCRRWRSANLAIWS